MPPQSDPSVVLLIPAYNEEKRIGPVLLRYGNYMREHYKGEFEIIVVLNGCRDNTLGVVEAAAESFPEIKAVEYTNPIGKGGALIEGLALAGKSELIGYVDADGATEPEAFIDLVRHCKQGIDCVIGSRWIPGAVLVQSQSGRRKIFSRMFHILVEFLFHMRIKDTQCGAKVMRRAAVEKIRQNLRIADVAFDINLLYSLKQAGYVVKEVPTVWTDQLGSKMRLNKGAFGIILSVIRLRLVYSPFYKWLRPLRPLEAWIYQKLSAPQPLPGPPVQKVKKVKVVTSREMSARAKVSTRDRWAFRL